MIKHKGGSTQSAKELKAKAKQDVVVPLDYNEMIFQLKAFAAMTDILFGEGSVVTKKLMRFIRAIDTNALIYKARAALDDFFPSKVLWAVCNRFQIFLTTCTHARDRDHVDDSIIKFMLNHTDIVLDRFSPTLPPCFKEVKNKVKIGKDADNENENEKVKKSKKQKKDQDAKQQRKQEGQTSNSEMTIKNEHQCKDFKSREGKQWRMFKTAGNSNRAKLNRLPM
jgi:hypothetical protein